MEGWFHLFGAPPRPPISQILPNAVCPQPWFRCGRSSCNLARADTGLKHTPSTSPYAITHGISRCLSLAANLCPHDSACQLSNLPKCLGCVAVAAAKLLQACVRLCVQPRACRRPNVADRRRLGANTLLHHRRTTAARLLPVNMPTHMSVNMPTCMSVNMPTHMSTHKHASICMLFAPTHIPVHAGVQTSHIAVVLGVSTSYHASSWFSAGTHVNSAPHVIDESAHGTRLPRVASGGFVLRPDSWWLMFVMDGQTPVLKYGYSLVTAMKTVQVKTFWELCFEFLDPFKPVVWIMVIACAVLSGLEPKAPRL